MSSVSNISESVASRAQAIENLEPGESISISKRVALDFGITADEVVSIKDQLRGIMDGQVHRVRRKYSGRIYRTEIVSAVSPQGAGFIVTCCCTRFE